MKWISVKERLPEAGDNILFYGQTKFGIINNDLGVHQGYYGGNGHWDKEVIFRLDAESYVSGHEYDVSDVAQETVTHWMPLPDKPQGF